MKNQGKIFEDELKQSILLNSDIFYQRLKDDTLKHKNVNNICDCILFYDRSLFLFELKATHLRSLPLQNIKENQITGLKEEKQKGIGISAGFLIKFYKTNKEKTKIEEQEVYFLDIDDFEQYFEDNKDKKSIPISYVKEKGILLGQTKKRTRHTYNIKELLNNIKKED